MLFFQHRHLGDTHTTQTVLYIHVSWLWIYLNINLCVCADFGRSSDNIDSRQQRNLALVNIGDVMSCRSLYMHKYLRRISRFCLVSVWSKNISYLTVVICYVVKNGDMYYSKSVVSCSVNIYKCRFTLQAM